MSTPEKCPKCGAVNLRFIDRNTSQFNCGSVSRNGTVVVQTALCTTNERDQLAERVKRLESVVTDPHALWSNWLRGDIQLPAGIGDIRECSEKMKRFRSRWLAAHKQMMEMENEAERASERVKRLEESADAMANAYEEIIFDRHDAEILESYRKVRGDK